MKDFSSYRNRPACFANVSETEWKNWIWQQQNAVRNRFGLTKVFPKITNEWIKMAEAWEKRGYRFLITPYVAALIQKDSVGVPLESDPVWRQVFPVFDDVRVGQSTARPDEYDPANENWEVEAEMISPIAQHKYDNRVLVITSDVCLGYCMYCFRSLQSNEQQEKHGGQPYWKETIAAILARPQVEEVILSGGDPLLYDNVRVEEMLRDLRAIPHVKAIRIHTRAWLHNPFRIDKNFCGLLKKYGVTEMGVHTIHPQEITADFIEAVERIREAGAKTLLMCDTPLVKGVNDSTEVLHELFMGLYVAGVKPYYLSHLTPNIPFAGAQRISVKRGLELYNSLKRKISNPAMPEYHIMGRSGKKTVPEFKDGTPDFRYEKDQNGWPIIRFKNWKGEWDEYLDATDILDCDNFLDQEIISLNTFVSE